MNATTTAHLAKALRSADIDYTTMHKGSIDEHLSIPGPADTRLSISADDEEGTGFLATSWDADGECSGTYFKATLGEAVEFVTGFVAR